MTAHTDDEEYTGKNTVESYERTSKDDLAIPTPIPSSSFYGASGQPTFPPQRRSTIGSSHTKYRAPTPRKGPEHSSILEGNDWREPEPVDDDIPELIPSDSTNLWNSEPTWNDDNSFTKFFDSANMSYLLDDRDQREEKGWWDPNVNVDHRPGPGMLPPMMESKLHNPEHTLFTVTVSPPDWKDLKPAAPSDPPSSPPPPSSPTQASHSTGAPATSPPFVPPTPEEIRKAVPHPNALYCRKHNGWVLLVCKSSHHIPPFTSSFQDSSPRPRLPDPNRRKTKNCIHDLPFGQLNKTHHFHEYLRSTDAKSLMPPYETKLWEKEEYAKHARRKMEVGTTDLDNNMVEHAVEGDQKSQEETAIVIDAKEADESTILLDLYVCCQCSLYVAVSDVIPGVIPVKYVESLTLDKSQNPQLGWTGAVTVMSAWDTIVTVIENLLWKGNNRQLRVNGKAFIKKLGWNTTVQRIFESLGFTLQTSQSEDLASVLIPPSIDVTAPSGKANRERLLRAWVEIGAYLEDFRRRYADGLKEYTVHPVWVQIDSAREAYQREVGAHYDQIARGPLPDFLERARPAVQDLWRKLGLSSTAYDPELFQFAYLAQCRCDPRHTKDHFTAAVELDKHILRQTGQTHNETMLVEERSRGRFTDTDLEESQESLGFGDHNELQLEFDDSVEDEFVLRAWKHKIRRSWSAQNGGYQRRRLIEALTIIAQARGSHELMAAADHEERTGMTPEKAYSTLEVPVGVDEGMLITVFSMRVEEQPLQCDRMRDALRVIAEVNQSERLQKFLDTGMDPGDISTQTAPEWPRGLNQLGNTCYLNSLLQYFYTIKDLRDAIAPLALNSDKFIFEDRVDEDDLKKHRVGGRAVTRSEVVRSRKFVSHLAELFGQLEYSSNPAVTPSLDLAKLALVTSKDEEEDETDRASGGTDSSNSTDATLVDDSAGGLRDSPQPQTTPRAKTDSPPLSDSPSSVLGKRTRGVDKKDDDQVLTTDGGSAETPDIDSDGFIMVSKPRSPSPLGLDDSTPSGSDTPMTIDVEGDAGAGGDIEMQAPEPETVDTEKAPPLPPRPKTQGSSEMMFGRQHDVAECMDNCMFQIETALLNFGAPLEVTNSDKTSVVKRLFYGKMRQRVTLLEEAKGSHKGSVHEREDHIAHLPVNVSDEQFDIYDGLSSYFDDVVEYNGAKAKMEVSLIDLPPILQIQLQRVQFDRETMQAYKSHSYVKFGETLYMDRFMDDAPAQKKLASKRLQAELNVNRERIRELTQSKYETLDDTWNFLYRQNAVEFEGIDESFLAELKEEKMKVEDELYRCRLSAAEAKKILEGYWEDERRVEYELTAVFVHRGSSPTFGHYFIYQRWLPDKPDSWFKYNDSEVSMVSKEEVLADTTGSTANPYLLVYARKDSQIIHTVQRADMMQL